MASEDRAAAAALTPAGVPGADYGFFQLLRMLRGRHSTRAQFEAAVRFQANLSLAFPHTDIQRVDFDETGKLRIVANFFGLYGVASPLPTFYTEDLIDEARSGGRAMRDLLDVIHNALYPMLFEAWEKNRIWLSAGEYDDRQWRELLMALAGRAGARAEPEADAWHLRFAGLASHRPRSALVLRTLVRGLTGLRAVRVETCVKNHLPVPGNARCTLGSARLGATLIGKRVARRSGAVNLHFDRLSAGDLAALLPGGALWSRLRSQLKTFFNEPTVCRLLLTPREDAPSGLRLGAGAGARVGWNAWLGGEQPGRHAQPVALTLFDVDTFNGGASA